MKVRSIEAGASLSAQRGEVVVCIRPHRGYEHLRECLSSILVHTPGDVPVLVCPDTAAADTPTPRMLDDMVGRAASEQDVLLVRPASGRGGPSYVNDAFASAAPADVVVLDSDCVVAEGWLERLRDAAQIDSSVATASALSTQGSYLSPPALTLPAPGRCKQSAFADAAAAVRSRSLRLRPRLLMAARPCVYVCRSALELVGRFEPTLSCDDQADLDFSLRCVQAGLCHVAADDVLVLRHAAVSFGPNGAPIVGPRGQEALLETRYPYYRDLIEDHQGHAGGALKRALGVARRAVNGLSVAVDARVLRGPTTGTQVHVLELIAAIAQTGEARVTAILPPDASPDARRALARLPDVRAIAVSDRLDLAPAARYDLVHRPWQIDSPADLAFLAQVADRVIITQQDIIGYRNPAYFRSFQAWDGYRQLTRRALSAVDHVVFFSHHALEEALAENLVERPRASVVHIGVDHSLVHPEGEPVAPREAHELPAGAEMILCLGTDLRHKNRVFALRVLAELRRRHDWPGWLVLAGPHMACGSSVSEEATFLERHAPLRRAVLRLGAVTEAEKAWLLGRAKLVLYPTVSEGFGLVPFEAAEHGVPCLWASGTSLAEVLPDSAAGIVAWDAAATADRAHELMHDRPARQAAINAVRTAAGDLRWSATARRLMHVYERTCDQPSPPANARERTGGIMSHGLSGDAMRLVGPGGALSRDLERPLLALATHPKLGQPVFGVMKAGYRVSHRLRRLSERRTRPGSG